MMDDESNPPFEAGLATNESGIFEGKLSTRNRANSAEKQTLNKNSSGIDLKVANRNANMTATAQGGSNEQVFPFVNDMSIQD